MQFYILVLVVCFLIFLFCLYLLAHDDFVLLRKDVSTEKVFNVAFLLAIFSLISGRVFFIVLNPSSNFLNPLVFLAFPYFPGLSLTGAVVGGAIISFFLSKKYKIPAGRFFDFSSFSFCASLPIGFLGSLFILGDKGNYIRIITIGPAYGLLFIIFLKFFMPLLLKGKIKEGTVGFLFLSFFSVISVINNFVERGRPFYFNIEDFVLIFTLLLSLAFVIKQEKISEKVKKYWEAKKS